MLQKFVLHIKYKYQFALQMLYLKIDVSATLVNLIISEYQINWRKTMGKWVWKVNLSLRPIFVCLDFQILSYFDGVSFKHPYKSGT